METAVEFFTISFRNIGVCVCVIEFYEVQIAQRDTSGGCLEGERVRERESEGDGV